MAAMFRVSCAGFGRRRGGRMCVFIAATLLAPIAIMTASCGSGDDSASGPQPSTAVELAPSQQSASTVPTPTLAPLCDPDRVGVMVVEPGDGVGQPDQIIGLVNDGVAECDVDISATGSAAPEMEPSVRLAPGGVGHVWVVGQDDCDETLADPDVAIVLDVNGQERSVDLTFVSPCGVELAAFFTD